MARLDSCYFCGAADDAPLNEVSISPRARRDDPDASVSVTLCSTCEDKLERVLRGLFDHVESRAADEEPTTDADEPTPEPDPDSVDRIDVASADPDGSNPGEGRRSLFTDPPDPSTLADESTADTDTDTDTDPDDAEIIDEGPRVRARAAPDPEDALDGVSVAEYNRVMRLLQNREFPMARAAFVDLAASAYDLSEDAVATVLDVLIDKGTLTEAAGELSRPGEDQP